MAFKLEKDMTQLIINSMDQFTKNIKNDATKYIYACEVPISYRMIDMVIADFCEDYNAIDECIYYEKMIKRLSSKCFAILSFITTRDKISIATLQKTFLMDRNELIECLDKLCLYKLIKKVSKFSYSVEEWSTLIPKELIAIELKLSRWQEALGQGYFNQRFAEYSYVILDKDKIKDDTNIINEYRNKNVGLIYLDNNCNIEIVYKPKKNKNIDKYDNSYYKIKALKDFVSNRDKWNEIK